jgi:ABC-type lipoprotein export system ATPase subunit
VELPRELNAEGLTLILVTHDDGVGATAPRLIRMRDGRIVADEQKTARVISSNDAAASVGR